MLVYRDRMSASLSKFISVWLVFCMHTAGFPLFHRRNIVFNHVAFMVVYIVKFSLPPKRVRVRICSNDMVMKLLLGDSLMVPPVHAAFVNIILGPKFSLISDMQTIAANSSLVDTCAAPIRQALVL